MRIVRRTFEAKKFPVGSEKRAELNRNWLTSEYYPSKRYRIVNNDGDALDSFATKSEAEQYINTLTHILTYV